MPVWARYVISGGEFAYSTDLLYIYISSALALKLKVKNF